MEDKKLKLVQLVFSEDCILAEIDEDKFIRPLCMTSDYHVMYVLDSHVVWPIDTGELYTVFGDDWNYTSCWEFIRENGFKKFLEKFGEKETTPSGSS